MASSEVENALDGRMVGMIEGISIKTYDVNEI
jgi:hypothetical protein